MTTPAQEKAFGRNDDAAIRSAVHRIMEEVPVSDIHTHLYAPEFGDLLLWGIDELLTYHYLIAEVMRTGAVQPEDFYAMSKDQQADLIWQELFIERAPISEACRGVATVLDAMGCDTSTRDLDEYRAFFEERDINTHIGYVFNVANLKSVIMTNDPFDEEEQPTWESGFGGDPRFHAALRIDPLLNDFENAVEKLQAWGYDAHADFSQDTISAVRDFLSDWIRRMDAKYMAVSLPPDFAYPDDSPRSRLIRDCIAPVAQNHGIPFAMMIGVKRAVNPALELAGDGVGKADIGVVERICAEFPDNKFLVTMLSRENQHELCVAARKFPNLLIFGCWWFLNNPSIIEEMTRERLELLGLSVVPQHSDARVLEQVIYKWQHSRQVMGEVVADKFTDLAASGWQFTESEIERDIERLLGGTFWDFLRA